MLLLIPQPRHLVGGMAELTSSTRSSYWVPDLGHLNTHDELLNEIRRTKAGRHGFPVPDTRQARRYQAIPLDYADGGMASKQIKVLL